MAGTGSMMHHCLPSLSTITVYHHCLPSLSTSFAYLDELSWGVAQEGQVVQGIMQHGGPPGGPRMLQGSLTLFYWPATCIQVFTHSFNLSCIHCASHFLQGPLTLVYWPATCIQVFTHSFNLSCIHCASHFLPSARQGLELAQD